MFSLFSKNKKEGVIMVLDIRSASVGGSLVLLKNGELPKILFTTRSRIPFEKDLNLKDIISSMIRTLKKVIDNLEKEGLVHLNFVLLDNKEIKEIFVFFSSPWYISQIQTIRKREKTPFFVTNELIQSMVKKDKDDFDDEDFKVFTKKQKFEIIDNKIVQFRLNRYQVNNPFHKKVNEVDASVFVSLLPTNIADKVEKTILKNFQPKKIHMNSFALPNFLFLRDFFKSEDDFIALDVSGEITDISYAKNDSFREIQSFPLGKNNFIRKIVKGFNITYENAISLINLYIQGKLDLKNTQKLESIIKEVEDSWVSSLEDSMLSLSDGAILPRSIFIIAEPFMGNLIIKMIRKFRFTKLVFPDYQKSAKPFLIEKNSMRDFIKFGKGVKEDVSIAIEATYINKLM